MSISQVGMQLADIKGRTGLTWAQLADTIGASSGDYVRKVASGAKPGGNLVSVVQELMTRGEVAKGAPRRTDATGKIAKVRASAKTGASSRRPSQTAVRAGEGRRVFQTAKGKLGWSASAGSPEEAAGLRAALASAGRGQKRVSFRALVRGSDGRTKWVKIGERGGYRPRDVTKALKGTTPAAWIASQASGRDYIDDDDVVVDIEVIAE